MQPPILVITWLVCWSHSTTVIEAMWMIFTRSKLVKIGSCVHLLWSFSVTGRQPLSPTKYTCLETEWIDCDTVSSHATHGHNNTCILLTFQIICPTLGCVTIPIHSSIHWLFHPYNQWWGKAGLDCGNHGPIYVNGVMESDWITPDNWIKGIIYITFIWGKFVICKWNMNIIKSHSSHY